MRTLLLASFAFIALSKSTPVLDKPVFEVIASRSVEEPPSIVITFANGVRDELMLTPYKMYEDSAGGCNYLGRLRQSTFSSAAVTGCLNRPGDIMEVTLLSEHNTNKMFNVDFFGNAEIIKSPFEDGAVSGVIEVDRKDGKWQRDGDAMFDPILELAAETAKAVTIPPVLQAVIKFGYDEGMKNRMKTIKKKKGWKFWKKRKTEKFGNWIKGVFTHTQAYFRHPSLGTIIKFQVQGSPIYKSGTKWNAYDNREDARQVTLNANLNGVDVTSWWFDHNRGEDKYAGRAYIGGLCSSDGYGLNTNEYQSTHSGSGFILAHELGHNFGMWHDHSGRHGGENGPCNKKGIMSYGSYSYNQWSSCSRSDFEAHYASEDWGNQNCLEDISKNTTTKPPTMTKKKCKKAYRKCKKGKCKRKCKKRCKKAKKRCIKNT